MFNSLVLQCYVPRANVFGSVFTLISRSVGRRGKGENTRSTEEGRGGLLLLAGLFRNFPDVSGQRRNSAQSPPCIPQEKLRTGVINQYFFWKNKKTKTVFREGKNMKKRKNGGIRKRKENCFPQQKRGRKFSYYTTTLSFPKKEKAKKRPWIVVGREGPFPPLYIPTLLEKRETIENLSCCG